LKKIQAEVTLKRLRIREFFLDFDGLRKNIVTGAQFKRILHNLSLTLSENEYKQIVKTYGLDPVGSREERIKWMDFCEDIDKVFTLKELEKDPLRRVDQIEKTVFEPVKHSALSFTPEESDQFYQLLRGYQEAITTKRLHLKPQFEDFDITKIGYVTKNQFCRILKQFDLTPPTDSLFNLLLKKYMDRGNLDEVNYYEFIRDVDQYGNIGLNLSKSHTETFKDFTYKPRESKATIRHQAPDDLSDLMARLRRVVKEKRIRVAEFMRDYDKLRHGNISKDQFRLALNMAQLPLSESEFKQIIKDFACEEKAGYVKWK
jgi:Ca2+-binding EF-hand superfamily protein